MDTKQISLPGLESEMTVSGKELAEWLCVTPAAVSQMAHNGKLQPLDGGKVPVFPLKSSVQTVIRELRGKRRNQGEGKDLERSLKFWQVEKAKQAVTSWRLQYGKDLALAILDRLAGALAEFQETTAADARLNDAALRLASALKSVKPDDVVYGLDDDELEGGDEGDGAV